MMPFDPIDYAIDQHTTIDIENEKMRAEYEWAKTPIWRKAIIVIESFVNGIA